MCASGRRGNSGWRGTTPEEEYDVNQVHTRMFFASLVQHEHTNIKSFPRLVRNIIMCENTMRQMCAITEAKRIESKTMYNKKHIYLLCLSGLRAKKRTPFLSMYENNL